MTSHTLHWYTRPIISVNDVEQSLHFYEQQLGFTQSWNYQDGGKTTVAQVNKGSGCELILSLDTERAGKSRIFVSLEPDVLAAFQQAVEQAGVEVQKAWWGYPVILIKDPDGNEMMFPEEDKD